VQHYYLYGPDIDQVLARLDPVSGIPDRYLTDYIGSVRAIVRDARGRGCSDTSGGKAIAGWRRSFVAGWRRSQWAVLAKGGELSGVRSKKQR
jgi:hypothetical protein